MPRRIPDAIAIRPPATCPPAEAMLAVSLPLECVTPVIGGGVHARDPDDVDYVRVPSIRGQLRRWWRAVQGNCTGNELFRREVDLWGGVDAKGGVKSRVAIEVKVEQRGSREPAGNYEPQRDGGGFKALPRWAGDQRLGYALFSLQRQRDELDRQTGRGVLGVPTHELRKGLTFTLELRVVGSVASAGEEAGGQARAPTTEQQCHEVMAAVWLWLHFGGVGARTTRGFGALSLRGCADCKGLDSIKSVWKRLFAVPASDRAAEHLCEGLERCGPGATAPGWSTLGERSVLVGPSEPSVDVAHAGLVGRLQTFRQGVGTGRAAGADPRRPGQSHWPEGDVLKLGLANVDPSKHFNHPPRTDGASLNAPRAAFGLPIQITFKRTDRLDDAASGKILADSGKGGRWTSPLRLRPLFCSDGRVVPVVLALRFRPTQVRVDKVEQAVPVVGTAGAHGPIATMLRAANGDAIEAFLTWLETQYHFRRVGGSR